MQRHHQAITSSRARGQGVLSDFVLAAIEAEMQRERDRILDELDRATAERERNEEQRLYEQSQEFIDRMENNHYF